MFFGLTNSPATFQAMMDTIFREEVAKGDTVGQKTVPMFGCFAKIEVEQIKKIS